MEVYYVELRKATVLEKKFIYSMCWLFGMELQFGAHTRQHLPPPYPPDPPPPPPHHHARPCPQAPGDFQIKGVFSTCENNRNARARSRYFVVEISFTSPHRQDVKRWSKQEGREAVEVGVGNADYGPRSNIAPM